jgi:hypothetical protein
MQYACLYWHGFVHSIIPYEDLCLPMTPLLFLITGNMMIADPNGRAV